MTTQAIGGTIVFHIWNASRQLVETEETFTSLNELFAHCLPLSDEKLVDRVIIHGLDDNGDPRRLTLVFESVTVI